jgi:hypothetical protein
MQAKHSQHKFLILVVLILIWGRVDLLSAQECPKHSPEILIKISQLEKTLGTIDELLDLKPAQTMNSYTTLLKKMLMGTHWIDPTRSIAMIFDTNHAQPSMAALIPFQQPNENFQKAFNAKEGSDYYILTFPPGGTVSNAITVALVDASRSRATASLCMELHIRELLKKFNAQIKEGFNKLENLPQGPASPLIGPRPSEIQALLLEMMAMANQIEIFTMSIDLKMDKCTISYDIRATDESALATLFTRAGATSLLDAYKPNFQMNYRSHSYDMTGMLNLLIRYFGAFYKSMGIDFSDIAAICNHFTGEMTQGVSFGKNGISFEAIAVLKDTHTAGFLEEVYVPWIIKYSQDLAMLMKKVSGVAVENICTRTPDSTVAGYKVIGIKTRFPLMGITTGVPCHPNRNLLIHSEMRMTTVGNLLLTAPDDKQLSKLIAVAKNLTPTPAKGSLITLDIDVTGYLRFLMDTMAMFPENKGPLPRMGRAEFVADLENGQARAACSMMTNDIKALVSYFKSLPTSVPRTGVDKKKLKETERQNEVEEDISGKVKVDIAQYWLDQGILYSTYGNHPKAIKYFKKVIALSPQDSKPHFNLGISYGELGKYEDAIFSLDKALELCPENGLYLYGRGRTYLLSGDKNKAIEDFKRAAVLGNQEAQDYLKNMAHVDWQKN